MNVVCGLVPKSSQIYNIMYLKYEYLALSVCLSACLFICAYIYIHRRSISHMYVNVMYIYAFSCMGILLPLPRPHGAGQVAADLAAGPGGAEPGAQGSKQQAARTS